MAGLSDYLEELFAGWINGDAMPSAPSALKVALFNGDPTDTGSGGTEVTNTIRPAGRVAATFDQSGGVLTSNASVDFGNAAAGATFSHFAIYDSSSPGNMLGAAALTGGSKTVGAGTQVIFNTGALTMTID